MSVPVSKDNASIKSIVGRILANAKPSKVELSAWKRPMAEIARLERRDYVRAVRRRLKYRELVRLVETAKHLWPELNEERLRILSLSELERMSRKLSLNLSTQPHHEPDGLALRGFYLRKSRTSVKRPMIYINTAHHPAAVMGTFCHEVAHHLGDQLSRPATLEPVHFFFDAAYSSHLDDPCELAADALVSLGAYPRAEAERIFSKPWAGGLVARAQRLDHNAIEQICHHLKIQYRVDFTRPNQPPRNLVYLAGMVHFAKLRWALLEEYDL
jgi:HD-like signal output (HDOD) protein